MSLTKSRERLMTASVERVEVARFSSFEQQFHFFSLFPRYRAAPSIFSLPFSPAYFSLFSTSPPLTLLLRPPLLLNSAAPP